MIDRAENIVEQWDVLESRMEAVFGKVSKSYRLAFEELVRTPIRLQANLNRLYLSGELSFVYLDPRSTKLTSIHVLSIVARSNLYATQGRTAANYFAADALKCFDRDAELTDEFHALADGKWN